MGFIRPFVYVSKYTGSLADGTSQQLQLQFANDSEFELREIRTTGTSRLYITIQFSNGELLSTLPFDAGQIGAGQNGWKFFDPILIPRGSQLTITLQNNSGGAITNPEVQFLGRKM